MSASVRSASLSSGSSESRRREAPVGEDARLWNDGGGLLGIANCGCGLVGDASSSSCPAICRGALSVESEGAAKGRNRGAECCG